MNFYIAARAEWLDTVPFLAQTGKIVSRASDATFSEGCIIYFEEKRKGGQFKTIIIIVRFLSCC